MHSFNFRWWLALAAGALLLLEPLSAQPDFFLKSGDTVVFYGDSITERGIYTSMVEAYVVTRFPKLNVRFVNSGWAGDTAAGGDGGDLAIRIQRDVIVHHPTVVTVLLGMNDGRYQKPASGVYSDFTSGYERLVRMLKAALPNVRLTLLEPSPYDDVTQPPQFPGGYNGVLIEFGQFIRGLGEAEHAPVADLNSAVLGPLADVNAKDPSAAREFIPDRVHPGPAASLLMAEALLKSWNAPAIVTGVEIDAASMMATSTVRAQVVSIQQSRGTLSWTQHDEALPFPVEWGNAPERVAAYTSDFVPAMDDQPLRVRNLNPGNYTLKIDGEAIITYPADQFARGINLSALDTPMLRQATGLLKLIKQHDNLYMSRWRIVQVPLAPARLPHYGAALTSLDALEQDATAHQRAEAQPRQHYYEIVPQRHSGVRRPAP